MLAAVGAGDMVVLYILEHLLLGHAVGVGLGVEVIDEVVGPVAHLTLLTVQKGVGKALDMAAGLPDPGVHEYVRVHLEGAAALLDKALAPGVLNVVLKPCPEGSVVPSIGEAAVNIAAGEDKPPGLAQAGYHVHGLLSMLHS